ncbi:MAG: hypothetical protein HY876_01440 [Coriobacteriales bacterium]|nr:hypothetical protein [Coriobacteriales bacterium]
MRTTRVRLAFAALGVVAAVSIVGNVIACRQLYGALDKYNDLRLDPLGIGRSQPGRARGRHAHFDEIVLVTVPPAFSPKPAYRVLYSRQVRDAHRELNEGIRELAGSQGVRVLDAFAILEAADTGEPLTTDGLHLSGAAYRELEAQLTTQ